MMTALPVDDGVNVTKQFSVVVDVLATRKQVMGLKLPEAVLPLAKLKRSVDVGSVGLVELSVTKTTQRDAWPTARVEGEQTILVLVG